MTDRWPPPWLVVLSGVMLAITLVFTFALNVRAIQDRATLSSQKAAQIRQDCARRIETQQADVKDAVTLAKAEMDKSFILGLLASQDPSQKEVIIADWRAKAQALDEAILTMRALPPYQRTVDRECPSGV